MTSDATAGCYVYITLPGATAPATCGKFVIRTDRRGVREGRFVYGRQYLARPDAVAIDPVELPLTDRTYRTVMQDGLFGAFRDASPDWWGRRLIEHHLNQANPGEMAFLLHSPDDRAGALGFGLNVAPPAPRRQFNRTLDLKRLQTLADALIAEESTPSQGSHAKDAIQVEQLLMLGTSMGGARPKAVVENGDGLWIAKFNRRDDRWNSARVEHAMLQLARSCGIRASESRVVRAGGRDVLLVRRFDRTRTSDGYRRARMVSALTMLRADDSPRSRDRWSYVLLAEELRRVCADPAESAHELFRRMCFNALISNIDDHPRNHAFIAPDQEWALSPAYDLTPSVPVSIERRDLAMQCGDAGRFANAANLLSQATRFLLKPDEARAILDTMEAQIRATWHSTARAAGVTERDCRRIAPAFAYPGFRHPL